MLTSVSFSIRVTLTFEDVAGVKTDDLIKMLSGGDVMPPLSGCKEPENYRNYSISPKDMQAGVKKITK